MQPLQKALHHIHLPIIKGFRKARIPSPSPLSRGVPDILHPCLLRVGQKQTRTGRAHTKDNPYTTVANQPIYSPSASASNLTAFYERWKMLEKEVIEPRNYERQNVYQSRNPYYRYDLEPFRVRRKDFWLLSTVTKLLKEFIPRLSHDADGLIFQMSADNHPQLFLNERGKEKLMEGNRVSFKG
ncbi:hypothetical protein CK203_018719 [Vitis vinifera]|uniref:mRNA capping enzyme adenylation domain-containing protein n=1 Tax=Vitis vinifera TaxID=29760 RepID=A0A438JAZ6_VITVI|nr:hypothetical protein CK203_018719 [Vitis vinifera]